MCLPIRTSNQPTSGFRNRTRLVLIRSLARFGVGPLPVCRWLVLLAALSTGAASGQTLERIAPLPNDDGQTWTMPASWEEMDLDEPAPRDLEIDVVAGGEPIFDRNLQPAQYGAYPVMPPDYASKGVVLSPCNDCYRGGGWGLDVLPDGLIYRSYMAGPREAKFQLNHLQEQGDDQTLWDVTLGGRRGLLRWGSSDPLKPEGWQLDLEGAAFVRINLDNDRDVDASDFRFGVPLTYGCGKWQYKFGYYHLSSHLGDEFMVRNPGATRINYVRDAIVLGVSYNPTPAWRLYGEVAYAFFIAGGAQPWELQFGVEYAQPGPTGTRGTPFFATNGHLREEVDFGGDYTMQVGWLWRGNSGSQFRTGFQLLTGKSNHYQWFDKSETQYGVAIWYDY